MSRTGRQVVEALARDAATAVLAAPAYAGRGIDPHRLAAANPAGMLLVIARYTPLRTDLARRYADEVADRHPLLRQLLDPDPATAEAAAVVLGRDPDLPGEKPAGRKEPRIPRPAVSGEERRAGWAARDLAEARKARDRARGQLEWALRERDAARHELAAASQDRDEALAVIESLRAQLVTERQRATALAGDPVHAADLVSAVVRPPEVTPPVDADPREVPENRADTVDAGHRGRVAAALQATGVSAEAFLTVLDAFRPSPVDGAGAGLTCPREMTVTPLGGGTDIGGSCLLVEVGEARLLVDAGMRPRQPLDRAGPPDIGIALSGRIDAVVVTHAHHDHAGYVPALVARQPDMTILCTADTAALLPTMWADSVRVFDRTSRETPSHPGQEPSAPYAQAQVLATQRRLRPVDYGRVVEVADGVTVELFPAGHILGAAGVVVSAGASRVTVTGDVSDLAQATVPGLVVPASARGSDLLVIESTYCQRRSYREAEVENFLATVLETVSAGGRVLVPAFALGRAQEVALTLRNRLPDVPVLVDGMAKQITRIYEQQTAESGHPLRIFGDQVREVAPAQRRQLIASFRRGVVVTTSGMLAAGPAVQWARSVLPDPDAALLLAGHQDAESPGAALLELADGTRTSFDLDGQDVDVRARVAKFALSAHADRRGLGAIVEDVSARAVMLVHGLPGAQREFARHLGQRGHDVVPTDRWRS